MQHAVYTVKDKAANAFLQPFFTQTEATAIRALRAATRDASHDFVVNAKDYSLYYVGIFDDFTGTMSQLQEPVFVVSMETIIRLGDPIANPDNMAQMAPGRFEKDVNHG